MTWLTAILAALSSAIAKIFKDVLLLLGIKRLGRLEAENEQLQEQSKQIQKDNEVLDAETPPYPDRYLRD